MINFPSAVYLSVAITLSGPFGFTLIDAHACNCELAIQKANKWKRIAKNKADFWRAWANSSTNIEICSERETFFSYMQAVETWVSSLAAVKICGQSCPEVVLLNTDEGIKFGRKVMNQERNEWRKHCGSTLGY